MKVERILAATDFSRSAESAVQRAAWLARNCGATLEIAHSIDLPILPEAWRKLVEGEGFTEEELRAQAQVRLDQLATTLALDSGITPGTLIFSGKPSQALAEFATKNATDLIVVGAHGEHFLLDFFVGSTAIKLLRLSTRPVLMVKQTPPFAYERLLIATDFSPASHMAAELAAELFPYSELYLFHVYEIPFERQMYYAGSNSETVDHYRQLSEEVVQRQMEEFVSTLAAPERFVSKLSHGYAPALIADYVSKISADLLVLGSRRQSGIAAALLGSVSSHLVAESRIDLLLVPLSD